MTMTLQADQELTDITTFSFRTFCNIFASKPARCGHIDSSFDEGRLRTARSSRTQAAGSKKPVGETVIAQIRGRHQPPLSIKWPYRYAMSDL